MTQRLQTKLLYLSLALYIVASLGYWISGVHDLDRRYWHADDSVQAPFDFDNNKLTVKSLNPEAAAAGLRIGDLVVGLNGERYSGIRQWRRDTTDAQPGDLLRVQYARGPAHQEALISLQRHRYSSSVPNGVRGWIAIMALMMAPSLIALLVGYWIAAARPRDKNAWLILVLLSFAEVLYFGPYARPGVWLILTTVWFTLLQNLGLLALFLLGVYFPERWRLDVRYPWVRWLLTAYFFGQLLWSWFVSYVQYSAPSLGNFVAKIDPVLDQIGSGVSLVCLVLYWVALFDKMRTASTADARRRLRVLLAGSLVGLGGVLVLIVWFPHLGSYTQGHNWPKYTGAALFLLYPFTLAYVVLVQRALDVRILLRMGTKYALARSSVVLVQALTLAAVGYFLVLPLLQHRARRMPDLLALGLLALVFLRMFVFRNDAASGLQHWIDRRFFREAYNAELVLSELSEQVRRFTEPAPLIETISHRISEVLHVPGVAVLLETAGQGYTVQSSGANGHGALTLGPQSYTVRNLRRASRPVTIYRENPDGWFLLADAGERSVLDALRAELLLPLPGRERLMGVMALSAKQSEEPYSPSDLRLLESVSTQAGLALEISALGHSLAEEAARRERIDREIEIAREVQERLLPQRMPKVAGATIAGACRPAQGVGGDYYDVIEFADGSLGLAIGDVSGKGISAALLMASLRASLRGMALDGPEHLPRVMQRVNRLVYEASASNRYATFFFAAYDPGSQVLRFVNAGHNPPLVKRGDQVMRLEAGGTVVGLLPEAQYEEQRIQLEGGDLLLAYTDGISEAMTLGEEEWGEERMLRAACADAKATADAVLQCVFAEADRFTAGAPQFDDMTVLVLRLEDVGSQQV